MGREGRVKYKFLAYSTRGNVPVQSDEWRGTHLPHTQDPSLINYAPFASLTQISHAPIISSPLPPLLRPPPDGLDGLMTETFKTKAYNSHLIIYVPFSYHFYGTNVSPQLAQP